MKTIITWDLGATKCAASLVEYDEQTQDLICKKNDTIKLTDCCSLADAVQRFENNLGLKMSEADAVCIGAAGHFDGEVLHHESCYPFDMSFAKIAKQQNWPPYAVIHDYAPVVCATFTSYMQDTQNVRRLNNISPKKSGRRVALGIGTGLGLKDGVLFENGDFWLGQNEMGHIGIVTPPSASLEYHERHQELLSFLRSQGIVKSDGSLTFEKILTGKGLVRLYQFLSGNEENLTPEQLAEKIYQGEAKETLALFAWYLGLFVGTVQLSFMPEEGIWITGGVVIKHLSLFDCPEFFHGIEATPAYMSLRRQCPLGVLCNEEHAFMGGAYYALKRLIK